MGKSLLGSIIYFWIFVIGGMFLAKVTGLAETDRDLIILAIILALFYWGYAFIKHRRKDKE